MSSKGKEIQPVHPKGDQSWLLIRRTDAKAEIPMLWPPDLESWLIWKDPDAGKDWGQEEKGTTEGEMAGWHHRLNGHEFGWTLGVGDGQGGPACCNSWGLEELGMTEQLNWTEHTLLLMFLLTVYQGSNFSTSAPTVVIIWFLDSSHPDSYETVCHCFNLHFLSV